MGGIGSGRQFGAGGYGRPTTEGLRSIDIRKLNKKGALAPGKQGELSWITNLADGSEKVATIGFKVTNSNMKLFFSRRVDGEDWEDVEQGIYLDRTPCNFGGYQKWFRCPGCGRRVAILYGPRGHFLCRHCYNLVYASQLENHIDRLMRKARKIRKRLGASDELSEPILEKPKYMHQKTFDRLRAKADEAYNQAWGVMACGCMDTWQES